MVRRMALHHRLPASDVLERCVRDRIVALLPGRHVQRDTALIDILWAPFFCGFDVCADMTRRQVLDVGKLLKPRVPVPGRRNAL